MELMTKQGYKKTEVGLIPEDWKFEKIEQHIDLLTGFPFPSSKYSTDGIRLLKGANVKRGQTDWQEKLTTFWNEDIHKYKQYELKDGDLVIAMDGSLVGRSYAMLSKSDLPALLLQRVARIRSKKIDTRYLKFFVGSDWFVKYSDSVKTVTAIPHISPKDIRFFKIPLPPTLTEQKAIATALSDVDALIASLEQTIAKKKAIKQGAMQQLLTPPHKGGKRLSGFSGEWVERPFTDMIWFQEGPGLRKWQFTSKGIKVINITNLVNGYLNLEKTKRHISWDEFNKMYQHFEVDEDDILVASSGNSYCKTSVVRKQDLPLVMNTSVIRFKPLNNLNYNLLLILLKSDLFKDQIDLLITGGAQPNFGPVHLPKVFFTLPKSMKEQKAIGAILSDMDKELEQLETKKEKYQVIKQGMMQELLTGKTRLV